MRAVVFDEHGGPGVLHTEWLARPVAAAGQIVIRVAAAGVNRSDLMERGGGFYPLKGRTLVGLECSGTVASVGAGVTRWHPGDEVCALLNEGGYAEYVVAEEGQVLPVPEGLSTVEAAALVEVAATVLSNFEEAGLRSGEVLLVHGGAGGIGTFAIQLATALGVRVICTAGSDEKREHCLHLGAEVAVDYRTDDFVVAVQEATAGAGADVVLDNMGASYLARNIEALAIGGRLMMIGFQGGTTAEIDLWRLWQRRGRVQPTALRTRPYAEKARIVARVGEIVWPLVASGAIRPVIDRVLPLEQAATAHEVIESSGHIGKVLLDARASA